MQLLVYKLPVFLFFLGLTSFFSYSHRPENEWAPRIEVRAGRILVNQTPILSLRVPAAGLEPAFRAELLAGRLREGIQANRKKVKALRVSKNEATLQMGGKPLITVTRQDAGGEPFPLAQRWAKGLETALNEPGLSLPVRSVIVPLGETRTLKIAGAAQGEIECFWEDRPETETKEDKRCEVQVLGDNGAETLVLRGTQIGNTRLMLVRDGANVALDIRIQPYAAALKAAAPIRVSGTSPSRDLLRRLVLTHAKSSIRALPGTRVWMDESGSQLPQSLQRTTQISIPIRVTGPDMVTVKTRVNVRVQVSGSVSEKHPTVLLYSNSPERIEKTGLLYQAFLPSRAAGARLLYHHQSHLPEAVPFVVELLNTGSETASVSLLWSQAGPVHDTVWVGFIAGRDFMQARKDGTQVRVDVPPQSRLVLIQETLRPDMTISGLCELRQTSGKPLQVRIRTLEPDASLPAIISPLDELPRATVSEDTYSAEPIRQKKVFTVGGKWCFIDLGKTAPHSLTEKSRRLEGDYGLTYDIEVELVNKTDQDQKTMLIFEAAAGLAGGAFFVDGILVTVPHTNQHTEITLGRFLLPPKSKRTVRIETIPLSGSNYPARLIVR